MDWKTTYAEKIVSAAEAVKCVKSGDTVVLQQAAGTAMYLMDALTDRADELENVKVIAHNLWEVPRFLEPQYAGSFRHVSQFLDRGARQAYREGRVDPLPAFYYQMPKYYREHPADVFFVMLTEPDEEGYCSYALNADYSVANMEAARTVVAQINPSLPWTCGAKVSLEELDRIVIHDQPLPELTRSKTGGVEEQIAAHIVPFIRDGACLQLGIGGLPDAILGFLKEKSTWVSTRRCCPTASSISMSPAPSTTAEKRWTRARSWQTSSSAPSGSLTLPTTTRTFWWSRWITRTIPTSSPRTTTWYPSIPACRWTCWAR